MEDSQSWRSVWQAVDNQCKVFATCGERGVCVFNASGSAECRCPFKTIETNKCLVPNKQDCASVCSNVNSCASSESVEMLLKSVGQEEFIPREAVIQESDACDELACLVNQMDPCLKVDEKIEFIDNVADTQSPSCIHLLLQVHRRCPPAQPHSLLRTSLIIPFQMM
ncbi:hypothetical protein KIW84_070493 [Lathyrus oleraceus]|uniref:S-locus glycoprotein domain-containing protein n=1 Tax=Pisum sativum TaxID=3888 RepID=A0A9D4ZRX3_PEA|nr:hypothetical protein KIW84_070491 [Pisum sativum]KAI5383107.1 hypothetical protein KIW84_070493 [Pisum sativum]